MSGSRGLVGWSAVKRSDSGKPPIEYSSSSSSELVEAAPDIWDSGTIGTSASSHIRYGGPPLTSGQQVYWKVLLWDRNGRAGDPSRVAWWESGLFEQNDWKARWITGIVPSPLFRKSFDLSKPVASARLYICGQGVYEVYINNQPPSDNVLGPHLSVYPVRMLYDTFDISDELRIGKNALAVQLAPGWFGGDRRGEPIKKPEGPGHALIAQISIRYADGSSEIIGTDTDWKTADSHFTPVISNWIHCYHESGELFDAENAPSACESPLYDDTAWESARAAEPPTKKLSARMIEPNRIVEVVRPVVVSAVRESIDSATFAATTHENGAKNWSRETMTFPGFAKHWKEWFQKTYAGHRGQDVAEIEVDFGKHVSGWVRIDATGQPGDTVTTFGLEQQHLGGTGTEQVGQRFAHRVFRYVPIHFSGSKEKPRIENIRAVAVQNDIRGTARFECSDETLNRIHNASARTWAVHMLSGMPMDSWRERFGTALIENCESAVLWNDMGAFYSKWMMHHRDQQREDGYFAMSGAPISYDYWAPNSGKNAIILVPWLMYLYYGDRNAVEENYPAICKWLELCAPKSDTGRTWQAPLDHGNAEAGFGDHARPEARWYEPHTGDLFETIHTIHCFRMAEQMARLLEKAKDAARYSEIRERLTAKVNRPEFFDRSTGLYGNGDQGCHALALHENVVPPELRTKVAENLIEDITTTRGNHLNTGFIGTWYLLKALILLGRPDVAVKIITNPSSPSYATMLQHPDSPEELTLLPEFFNSGMIPHPGWCSVGFWFYQSLAGIHADWNSPGFERFSIRPQITRELEWIKAEYDSIAGKIGVDWSYRAGQIEIRATVPINTSALVHVPAKRRESVEAPDNARFVEIAESNAVFEVDGGTFTFRTGEENVLV